MAQRVESDAVLRNVIHVVCDFRSSHCTKPETPAVVSLLRMRLVCALGIVTLCHCFESGEFAARLGTTR